MIVGPEKKILSELEKAPSADPMSEVSSRERRALLLTSLLAVAVTAGGLVPVKVAALGIELSPPEQTRLLVLLALVVSYFLVAFLIYGLPELRRSLVRQEIFKSNINDFLRAQPGGTQTDPRGPTGIFNSILADGRLRLAKPFVGGYSLRMAFDFIVPLVFGLEALALLIAAILHVEAFPVDGWWTGPGCWFVPLGAVVGAALLYRHLRGASDDRRSWERFEEANTEITQGFEESLQPVVDAPKDDIGQKH
jgi:hypothetical protein